MNSSWLKSFLFGAENGEGYLENICDLPIIGDSYLKCVVSRCLWYSAQNILCKWNTLCTARNTWCAKPIHNMQHKYTAHKKTRIHDAQHKYTACKKQYIVFNKKYTMYNDVQTVVGAQFPGHSQWGSSARLTVDTFFYICLGLFKFA